MKNRPYSSAYHAPQWWRAGIDAWVLGLEASTVVALRTLKIAAGGAAATSEAQRMINEKIEAGLVLQARALTGKLGRTPQSATKKALAHYRRKVRANRRRLLSAR